MSSEADRMEAPMREQKELRAKLRKAEKRKRSGEVQRLRRLLQEKGLNNPALRNAGFVRAAELPSPAPAGHFIRQFGSSDREQIANANDAASIPQVLSLMNGFVDNTLLPNKQSELWRTVNDAGTNNDRITILYKTLLNREPSRTEMTQSTRDMRTYKDEALEDLLWVIVNSREFMFVL
jgi:type I site-specific restriction-modification system R (restriction) subunit